eukprot:GHVT01104988.1.p1 GENE.GHVT01104988.1~~GHVT01104988.1.p1  ORF type:complete len:125 (-),score=9.50 GHVT01104988.1:55-429(-)
MPTKSKSTPEEASRTILSTTGAGGCAPPHSKESTAHEGRAWPTAGRHSLAPCRRKHRGLANTGHLKIPIPRESATKNALKLSVTPITQSRTAPTPMAKSDYATNRMNKFCSFSTVFIPSWLQRR